MDKYNVFKVEDEAGKVSLYRKMKFARLTVGKGELSIPAKLVGFVDAAEAAEDIPTFEVFAAGLAAAAPEEKTAA